MAQVGLAFRQQAAQERAAAVTCSGCGHAHGEHRPLPRVLGFELVAGKIEERLNPAYRADEYHCECGCVITLADVERDRKAAA